MSTLSLRIPESLHKSIRELSESEGISINQFLTSAAAEKMSALKTVSYLKAEASKSNREDFLSVLAKVPDIEPEPHDAI
ncbi:MAG: type II toxin-antitoxin system HicB family antitoxin [Opitutales bacterium]|nr:type II toxin-antitoxin system HicB family antitoxin [Opitutales bacterium]NRA26191.1 toxin-antitoxin system HicB family antitoxin [Opitutales bacterium]